MMRSKPLRLFSTATGRSRIGSQSRSGTTQRLAREAETVQFDTAMLRALGLTDAADADRWLIYDVQFRWDGDIRIQRAECQRGEFRERSVDWWRERDDNA